MKFLSAVHNTTVPCSQSQSLCLFLHALLYEISKNSDTDRFQSLQIKLCAFSQKKIQTNKTKQNKTKKNKGNSIQLLLKLHV